MLGRLFRSWLTPPVTPFDITLRRAASDRLAQRGLDDHSRCKAAAAGAQSESARNLGWLPRGVRDRDEDQVFYYLVTGVEISFKLVRLILMVLKNLLRLRRLG